MPKFADKIQLDSLPGMARVQAALWLSGGLAGLLAMFTVLGPTLDRTGFGLVSSAAVIAGVVQWAVADRATMLWLQWGLVGGSVTITASLYFQHSTSTATELLYIWEAMYAFYFFGPRARVAQVVFIALAYGAVLLSSNSLAESAPLWGNTVTCLFGVAVVILMLRGKIDRLVAALGAAADTDLLTGTLNRRGLEAVFSHELTRARRHNHPLGVLLVDIDHFKRVNDTFGHDVGDQALVHVATILQTTLRSGDTVARVGGEEFLVLMPEVSPLQAQQAAERLRRLVQAGRLEPVGELTISGGLACLPAQGNEASLLRGAADRALYRAKAAGRNRVMLADAPDAPTTMPLLAAAT